MWHAKASLGLTSWSAPRIPNVAIPAMSFLRMVFLSGWFPRIPREVEHWCDVLARLLVHQWDEWDVPGLA